MTKILKKLDIFRTQMVIYKINFDEDRCVFFVFVFVFYFSKRKKNIKYIEISEKVSNLLKNKFNSELICNKKYLKAEKKEAFNVYMYQ